MPEGLWTAVRADPVGARPPVEVVNHSTTNSPAPRKSRFPPRFCLRKGCDRQYVPAASNQRYCQDSNCLQEVHRWLALKRQQRRRERPAVRAAEAAVAKARRERRKQEKVAPDKQIVSIVPTESSAAERASLRSRKNPGRICDRVGCYEPPRTHRHCGAAYCSHECRDSMRRVRDRERKYFWRRTPIGRLKCETLAMRRRTALQAAAASLSGHRSEPVVARAVCVHPPPEDGFSWVDRRFLPDYAPRLSRDAVLLYFFFASVSDQPGPDCVATSAYSGVVAAAAEAPVQRWLAVPW